MSKKTERARERQAAAVKGGVHPVEKGPSILSVIEHRVNQLADEFVALDAVGSRGPARAVWNELKGTCWGLAAMRYPYRLRDEGDSFVEKLRAARHKRAVKRYGDWDGAAGEGSTADEGK